MEHVVRQVIPAHLLDKDTIYHINPSGRFVIGGPQSDAGLTGEYVGSFLILCAASFKRTIS